MPSSLSDSGSGLTARQWAPVVAGLVLVVLLVPTLVVLSPRLYFDVDPRSAHGGLVHTHLGPAATMGWHALSALAGLLAMATGLAAGVRARWGSALAITIAACFIAGWGWFGGYDDRLHAGALLAAAALGLGLLHLGQIAAARRWLAAGLIASLVPMAVDAFWYVFVEHPETLQHFYDNEASFLAARGWEIGSSEHVLYVRRMTFTDATGPFGLANVFASLLAAATLLAMVVGLGSWRQHRPAAALALLVALMGLGTLALTHSKGGVLALVAGGGLALAGVATWSWPRLGRGLPGLAVLGLVAIVALVLLRGAVGPPPVEIGEAGERSLLFRAQYWAAAARIYAEAPVTGQGVQGFANAYLRLKDPLNPEEVSNAHNVVVDYLAMYGLGGGLCSALLLVWLVQAAGQVAGARAHDASFAEDSGDARDAVAGRESGVSQWRRRLYAALAVGGALFAVWYAMELPQLWWLPLLVMLAAMVGFALVLACLVPAGRIRPAAWTLGLLAAAGALLGQGMIEMTWIQPASLGLAWAFLALAAAGDAAGPGKGQPQPPSGRRWLVTAVPAALVLLLVAGFWLPQRRYEQRLAQADAALRMQTPQGTAAAIGLLDEAAALQPADRVVQRWRVTLRMELAMGVGRRGDAASLQMASRLLADAQAAIDQAQAGGLGGPMPHRLRAELAELAGELGIQERAGARRQAVEHLQQAMVAAPYSLRDAERLADLFWDLGEHAAAAEAYHRMLLLSDQAYLDSGKQLPADRQARARERIAAAAG